MNNNSFYSYIDHTILKQTSTWSEVKKICDDAINYNVASVCIPPCYVKKVKEYVGGKIPVCTVIGFPNGYASTASKVFETTDAVNNGADEIDVVINLAYVKDGLYDEVLNELMQVKVACGTKLLKVIIETCLLTEEEKIKMCEIVTASGAEYIKTSTGFSTGGATLHDVKFMKKNIGKNVLIKASGGISNTKEAEDFILAGASRLGSSRLI